MIELKTEIPGPKSQALMRRRQAAVARGPFHVTPVFVEKAKGSYLVDVDGNRLLDFASGIGVTSVGHLAEPVISAIREQTERSLHLSFNVTAYENYILLCEKLNAAAPGDFPKKSFLANSGAEAVENAIKIARAYTGRSGIICFDHAFHGRTYMALTLTSKAKPYKIGFGPYNPDVYRAPFPYVYRWPGLAEPKADPKKVSDECFVFFEDLVVNQVGVSQTAAVIIEPVLGEGGFVPAPAEFMAKLRAFCTAQKIVLIADEIQTGFGRTGTFFACEQLGIEPDLITTAKGLGGGMPISAVTGRAEMMDAPPESGIGGTFGGNPLACASALAVFSILEKGELLANARRVGESVRARLLSWKERFRAIGDVRGLGPMQAMEFVKDPGSKAPNPDLAKGLLKYCYQHGLVVMTAGTFGNVVRLLMPLSIAPAELEEGMGILEKGLQELAR